MQMKLMSLDWMVLMATFNTGGAAFYASRVPERWWPYRFDFIGASHQIFHVAVIFAGLAHYAGLTRAFIFIREIGITCGA